MDEKKSKNVNIRKTPFSQMFIDNMSCFPPEQLEKILQMEPKGLSGHIKKARFGTLLETSDFRSNGLELFKARNKVENFDE